MNEIGFIRSGAEHVMYKYSATFIHFVAFNGDSIDLQCSYLDDMKAIITNIHPSILLCVFCKPKTVHV